MSQSDKESVGISFQLFFTHDSHNFNIANATALMSIRKFACIFKCKFLMVFLLQSCTLRTFLLYMQCQIQKNFDLYKDIILIFINFSNKFQFYSLFFYTLSLLFLCGTSSILKKIFSLIRRVSNSKYALLFSNCSFITMRPCEQLNRKHTVFGRLVGGGPTLDKIEKIPVDDQDRP